MTSVGSLVLETTWRSHIQTTDPPRLTPHDIWTLDIHLRGPAPLRVVSVLHAHAEFSWALDRAGGDPPQEQVDSSIALRPWGWADGEDRVSVHAGPLGFNLSDRALLDDPRSHVKVVAPRIAPTGSFLPILEVPAHGATIGLIALEAEDTEDRRGRRWRLRPDKLDAVDPRFAALASGHQSGNFPEL